MLLVWVLELVVNEAAWSYPGDTAGACAGRNNALPFATPHPATNYDVAQRQHQSLSLLRTMRRPGLSCGLPKSFVSDFDTLRGASDPDGLLSLYSGTSHTNRVQLP